MDPPPSSPGTADPTPVDPSPPSALARHLPWILILALFLAGASSSIYYVYIAMNNPPEQIEVEHADQWTRHD